jgi:hypothetical protein
MARCRQEYERSVAAMRDERMRWLREARFDMVVIEQSFFRHRFHRYCDIAMEKAAMAIGSA